MNKILKMVGTASLVGSMMMLAGCGGGGGSDDNDTVTPPPATKNEVTVTTSGTYTATAAKDTFRFAANDGINYTITGFATGDVILFPTGTASVTVENGAFDDKAVVKWVHTNSANENKEIRVTLAGLTDAVDRRLTSVDAFNTEFGPKTIDAQ